MVRQIFNFWQNSWLMEREVFVEKDIDPLYIRHKSQR